MIIDEGDISLFCHTMGTGTPLIAINGGVGLPHDYLLPGMEKLAESAFVIFYDQRGVGRSNAPLDSISIESFVEDVEIIRRHFGYEKVSLLGHSWGAFLAMKYAIAYPGRLEKLILANPMPASTDGLLKYIDAWSKKTAPNSKEIEALEAEASLSEDPAVIEKYYQLLFSSSFYNPEKACLLNLKDNAPSWAKNKKVNGILNGPLFSVPYDLHTALRLLAVPTLVVHGENDLIPLFYSQQIAESIPDSQLMLMRHCGHFPYVEDPAPFFNRLAEFIDQLTVGSSSQQLV